MTAVLCLPVFPEDLKARKSEAVPETLNYRYYFLMHTAQQCIRQCTPKGLLCLHAGV
jgi:hypothetical protein